jgi:hypothetical protein
MNLFYNAVLTADVIRHGMGRDDDHKRRVGKDAEGDFCDDIITCSITSQRFRQMFNLGYPLNQMRFEQGVSQILPM